MVLSRNDKRKRKEGDLVDLMDPLAEPSKRTKIHAQRKFAQGAATPIFSPTSTPIKEKEKVKPTIFRELITQRRPNTEDFLTFLCFRGTSILPSSLNFFSATSKRDRLQNASKPSLSSGLFTKSNGTCGRPTPTTKAEENVASIVLSKSASVREKPSSVLKKQTPSAIPKTIKLKTTSSAIQALKKKYQEQRLAKQRLNKFKPTYMKTRSCVEAIERVPDKSLSPKITIASKKILSRMENKRHGLRSTGPADSEENIILPLKSLKKQIPVKLKRKNAIVREDTSSLDSIPVRNGPRKIATKLSTVKPIQKKLFGKSKKFEARRVTRSRTDVPVNVSPTPAPVMSRRPTRKTKEAAAVYMEILGRKLVSPELENEDNMSLDSFPELPNARKIAQTENEIKAKVKSLKAAAANINANADTTNAKEKEKEKKVAGGTSTLQSGNVKPVKRKLVKPMLPLKNKRLVKVQRYREVNSDEESVSSKDTSKGVKTSMVSKRSVPSNLAKEKKFDNRSLRSSRSLTASRQSFSKLKDAQPTIVIESVKTLKNAESQVVAKSNKENSGTKEGLREKSTIGLKRKRDSTANDKEKDKENPSKQKFEATKNKGKSTNAAIDSEEESLGAILNKMKRKKETEKEESVNEASAKKSSESKVAKSTSTITTATTTTSTMTGTGTSMNTMTTTTTATTTTTTTTTTTPTMTTTTTTTMTMTMTMTTTTTTTMMMTTTTAMATATTTATATGTTTTTTTKWKSSSAVIKSTTVEMLRSQAVTDGTTTKISDDEESFRGFTKKAISKVANTCQSHVKTNKLMEEIDSKANVFKTHGIALNASPAVKDTKKVDIKLSTTTFPCIKPIGMSNTVANASVKQEPDFEDLKIEQTSKETNKHSKISCTSTVPLNIIDIPNALGHGRKERVNMSTEQIEKWLNESSLAKEESKVEMESVANFKYDLGLDKPKIEPPVTTTPSHLSISPKIQHLVRPVNVTLSKLSDRLKKTSSSICANRTPSVFLASSQISPVKPQTTVVIKPKPSGDGAVKDKQDPPNTPPSRKMSKDSSCGDDAVDNDAISKSDGNSIGDSSERKSSSSPEKKVFFHQRKPFLPKVKERKVTSSASAFSPENESSVYAFESEAEAPVSTPFRRKAKEATLKDNHGTIEKSKSANDEAKGKSGEETKVTESLNSPEEARKDEEKSPPLLEKTTPKNFELPKNFADLTNIQVLPLDKLTTSWSSVNCSASIAVQVNLEDQKQQQKQHQKEHSITAESNNESTQKSTEISTQTDTNTDNDDDNDSGQLFYIPLQAVTRNTSAQGGQQLIQGVAVKLGTEGPTGPNQRVLLKAKLVTKPPISVARCPPIGTVQPTARLPQNSSAEQFDVPSTSTHDSSDMTYKHQTPEKKGTKAASVASKIQKSPKSRERKASLDMAKGGKKVKIKNLNIYSPINKTTFPKTRELHEEARLVEAPTFRPSEKDFQDPLEYIEKIRSVAEQFGICKVIPPSNFKPECKVSDDMRFTAYNHYVHRMLHRWGPNVREMMAIKKYLATQSITLTQPPWVGGMEVDLPHLYQTVQTLGGLKEVIEKKKWQKVADGMKIPRSAQDRVTKLDDIYCKYLLPYDTLSQDERDKLFKDVEDDWTKREKDERQETQSNENEDEDEEDSVEEIEECIVKGRNMPLNAFYRIARNTQRMWFGETQRSTSETDGPSAEEVETAFWRHVVEKKRHVCVHAASIDSSGRGFGFSVAKNSPFARHAWNLKVLTNNAGSVLRALGPQMGVTVPTLHVGMLFSACCWYRDPHGLPWIEYLHTGAKKIWYGIPDEQNVAFRKALTTMFPRYCKNKTIWLPSDTAMVPPDMLVSNGVPLCQTVQEPGQFIVVFPKAFTSSICTGYVVSESVYFAHQSWLETAEQVFRDIHDSCEPSIFSFERLLFSIINDSRSHIDVLKQILPSVIKICDKEIKNRQKLKELGLINTEKLPLPETEKKRKGKKVKKEEGDYECDTCRANLFVSIVSNPTDESIFCLTHAIQYIQKKKQVLKNCTLMYTYSESELNDLIHKLKDRIEAKSKKTNQMKQAK